jgi:tetratricopeptide (TPR) repeat protein
MNSEGPYRAGRCRGSWSPTTFTRFGFLGTNIFLSVFFTVHSSVPAVARTRQQSTSEADAFQKGLTALKENRIPDALVELTTAEQLHPDDPRIHNFRGIALVKLGESAEAAEEYREALRLDPQMAEAYRNLGFLNWTEHQYQSAREALQTATVLAPDDPFAHYYLGRVLLDLQQFEPAIRELELCRIPPPGDAALSLQLTSAYLALGRATDADASLDRTAELHLTDEQSLQFASLLVAAHRSDFAVKVIQKLRTLSSDAQSTWLQFDLALAHLLAGNYEQAAAEAHSYLKSLTAEPPALVASAQAWSLIGISEAHLQQSQRSIDAFRQATALQPCNEEHWLNLTRELMELSRYPEAVAAVQNGLATIPQSYALHLRLGAAQLSAGHYREAETAFRELVNAGDPLPTGYIGLAQVLLRTGRAEEAISVLNAAREKLPPNFLLEYFLGLSYDRAGKPTEALTAFQYAEKLNSNNAEIHISLGKTKLALGRAPDAIAEFQQALRLSPRNPQATHLLAQASRRAGKTDATEILAEDSPVPTEQSRDLVSDFFIPTWQKASSHP